MNGELTENKIDSPIENTAISIEDLEKKLLFEDNPDEIKEIVDIFNLNLQKKRIVRANKLSELQDKIFNQMDRRIEHRADDFSNKDLLDYFKTVQDTLNKSDTTMEMDMPVIQVNQQQINVGVDDGMSREDKMKVLDVVKSIIGNIEKEHTEDSPQKPVDADFSVLEEEEEIEE